MTATASLLQQQAKKAPLPCFGLELNKEDPRCIACPHQKPCTEAMGTRWQRVPLSKANFQLVPVTYKVVYDQIDFADPEEANVKRTYVECHQTVFGKDPDDTLGRRDEVVKLARANQASIRLFILSVMMGHKAQDIEVQRLTERGRDIPFNSGMLLGKLAETRFKMFRDVCTHEYGTFSVSRISALFGGLLEINSPELKLLSSEVRAAQCILGYKMGTGGPYFEHLYTQCELSLDPLWLAIEPSYKTYVLDPYRENPRGSTVEKDHRHAVSMTITRLKKHRNTAIMAFQAREAIMHKAIAETLRLFGYGSEDFLISSEPITDCLSFWNWLALAIQHDECLRYVEGGRSRLIRS